METRRKLICREFAEREDWDSIQLKEGDKVDFLYFMGGGSFINN